MVNQRNDSIKYFHILYCAGITLGFIFSLIYSNNQIITGDQLQMLNKGYLGASKGLWLSYGNAASAVGNVPGSLSAYIVGIPLKIWFSPWAPMIMLILLRFSSFLLFDSIVKKVFGQKTRLLFLILYWLNPWFLFESLLYNPSYLCFFTALHFWSAFNMHQTKSVTLSFIHFLSIGLAAQLHYSWPILLIITSYLIYRKIIIVHWRGFFIAIIVITASLIPYIQELLSNEAISKNADINAQKKYIGWGGVHVYPVLKAFLYWLRYGAFIFSDQITLGANFKWISSEEQVQSLAVYIWRISLYTIGGISLIISLIANKDLWLQAAPSILKKEKKHNLTLESWITLYVFSAFIGVTISAILSPIIFNHWHLIIIFPIAIFPLTIYIIKHTEEEEEEDNTYKYKKITIGLLIYFTLINIVASQDSSKFTTSSNYSQQVLTNINFSTLK